MQVACRQRFGAWRSGGLEVQMFKLALMLIEVKMLKLALMPPFCQTPVMCTPFLKGFAFLFNVSKSIHLWFRQACLIKV